MSNDKLIALTVNTVNEPGTVVSPWARPDQNQTVVVFRGSVYWTIPSDGNVSGPFPLRQRWGHLPLAVEAAAFSPLDSKWYFFKGTCLVFSYSCTCCREFLSATCSHAPHAWLHISVKDKGFVLIFFACLVPCLLTHLSLCHTESFVSVNTVTRTCQYPGVSSTPYIYFTYSVFFLHLVCFSSLSQAMKS